MYQLRINANGDVIDEFATYQEAYQEYEKQEQEDIYNGDYVDGESYYEIYNTETDEIEFIQNR